MTDFPDVKLKALVQFPASVRGGAGIDVVQANGIYTIALNYEDLTPPVEILPTGDIAAVVYNLTTNTYYLTPIETIADSGTSGAIDPAAAVPLVESGVGTVGVSVKYAREDHVHPAAAVGGIDQNSQSTNYTTVLADAQKHMLHPTADTTARTFTIAANASVAYPVGTAVTFVNQHGAGVLTIACGDTMYLASAGTTGNRTLAANGVCTALKITATEWIISGKGLT